jgi:O-antigen/teichoic acid export membrane protein
MRVGAVALMVWLGSTVVPERPPEADPAPRSFLRSALQTYGTNVAGAVLSLLSVLIIARALGPEGRGTVAYLTALAWLAASLSTVGVQEANANFAAADASARRALATNSVMLSVLFGGVAIVVLAGLIELVPAVGGASGTTLRWVTLAFVPLLILQICLRMLVQADYGFAVSNAAYLIGPVLNAGVNGVLAAFGALTVEAAVGVWLAGQGLGTVLLVWYVLRRLAGFGRADLPLARRSVGFGARAHVGRVMQLGNYRLDQVLLGAIAGPRELGLYSVAVAWAEALWFLPTTLSYVQRPDLVRARSRAEAARQSARAFRATAGLTAACALVMVAAAPLLCTVLFGRDFEGAVDDLRVLVAGAFGMVALKILGTALVARGLPGLQSAAIGTGFAVTVVLNVVLIPPLGGLGAALASTLAYTASGFVVALVFLRALEGRAADLVPRTSDLAWFAGKLRHRITRPAPASAAGPGEPNP